ncbi:hypothetical protein [Nocardia sp. NBC_01009]|uniref:hypothetical protein n=1 Tax=Nocardia sp. NBC_01009 TaxID=2975996 RepID=UPI00386A9B31|nr:hypothetical protein OHA42_13500 [Nocardia sp. NBC_01009]
MVRRTFVNKLVAAAMPLAVAVTVAGGASADPGQLAPAPAPVVQLVAEPVVAPVAAGIPLEEIATNPEATNHDPLANGAAGGALAGAAGSGVLAGVACLPAFIVGAIPCAISGALNGALWGTVIGLLVGALAPEMVPQVLP